MQLGHGQWTPLALDGESVQPTDYPATLYVYYTYDKEDYLPH